MFRADRRIIKSGRDRVRFRYHAVRVLKHVGVRAVQHAGPSAGKARSVFTGVKRAASGLHSNHFDFAVGNKIVEKSDGIAAAAYAGEKIIRQPPGLLKDLPPRFLPDDAMEVA